MQAESASGAPKWLKDWGRGQNVAQGVTSLCSVHRRCGAFSGGSGRMVPMKILTFVLGYFHQLL